MRNPDIYVVFALGVAGCGKTFLACDAGIEQVIQRTRPDTQRRLTSYGKIVLTRPIVGHRGEEEIGFLPGGESEKLTPWLGPFSDQFDVLFDLYDVNQGDREDYFSQKKISVQVVRTMRGRSFSSVYWIVDEAENLTSDSCDTVMTRPAGKSKLVLVGDPSQTDLKNVDLRNMPVLLCNDMWKSDRHSATIYFDSEELCCRGPIAQKHLEYKRKFLGNNS